MGKDRKGWEKMGKDGAELERLGKFGKGVKRLGKDRKDWKSLLNTGKRKVAEKVGILTKFLRG